MSALGQKRPIAERCPNDRFPIYKRPLQVAPTNGCFWPKPAIGAGQVE